MSDVVPEFEIADPLADTALTDRKQVKGRQKQADIAERERQATLQGIMRVKQGRKLMWWLLDQCGAFRSAVAYNHGGSVDPIMMGVNDGKAQIGHMLMAKLTKAAPKEYIQMLTESEEKENG